MVQGGQAGTAGQGSGAGQPGSVGGNGSGPKQQCLTTSDAAGVIGGAGGAGGGGGAAYGGNGTPAANGGAGTASHQAQGLNISTAYSVVAGTAGTGGLNGAIYGTDTGLDIDLGSGGSGGGILLKSNSFAKINGTLSSKGGNGGMSGQKGNGASCNYTSSVCSNNSLSTGQGNLGGDGGAGGGGRVKVIIPVCNMGELNPTLQLGGGNGPTTGYNGTYNIICSPVSIESLGEKYFEFDAFPNPANEVINIRFKNSEIFYNDAHVEVYDLNGRLMLQENCTLHKQGQQSLNIQEFNKGLYIVRLQADGYQLLKKFIKQ